MMHDNIQQEDSINIKEIVFHLLSRWKWITASVIVCLLLAVLYLLTTNNKYEIKSSILIKDNDSGITETAILDELGFSSGKNNVYDEIELLKSADLIRSTIYATNHHISYRQNNGLKKELVYKKTPLIIEVKKANLDTLKNIEMVISKNKSKYIIETNYNETQYYNKVKRLPAEIKLPFASFVIKQHQSFTLTDDLYITIKNPETAAVLISKDIEIAPSTTNYYSNVIRISINNENIEKGKVFLQKLIENYNLQAIEDKNLIAYNTSIFIDVRLKSLSKELKYVEKNVESFKSNNKITDISSEAQLFIEQTGVFEGKLNEIETQINIIGFIEDFVGKASNKDKLIPNLGITDIGLVGLINKHNELILEKERIQKVSSNENPSYHTLVSQLNNMHNGIKSSVENVKKTLLIAKRDLKREENITAGRIQEIPRIEREFLEIKRQQQIKETLYLFLLQKKEETNLTLAATTPKAKIVSHPRAGIYPVSPQKEIIILIALILGFFTPIIVFYLIELLQTKISSKEDLEKLCKAPIIGEIPTNRINQKIAVGINDTSSLTELFRSLRNNLIFILNSSNKKIISITSTVSGEGKTFVASNLAQTFAMIEKKVLLVGLDIRNPSLAEYVGITKKKGLTSYLSNGENIENLIEKSNLHPYLDIIQAGIIPPNPNELLNKDLLDNLFEDLKKDYDYILVDTAPVGIISDTFLINRISDLTLYVTRENITSKSSITYINDLHKENKLSNINVILNDTDIEKKGYGYGYGYGYKYYQNKKKNFKSILSFMSKKHNN